MQSQRALSDWLDYLESIHPTTIDMGLDRVKQVADRMGIRFDAKVIIVGGTNGKGSTCAVMEQALLQRGQTVGVYSSPHLLDYRERVRINCTSPDEQAFCTAFEHVESVRAEVSLTYFEFGTLAALSMLMDAQLDVVILEVGLGGRLDATNIVEPDCAVITSIGLDHQDWLGDTREAIAIEKAGIIRDAGLAVIGELEPPITLLNAVQQKQANAWWVGEQFSIRETASGSVLSMPDGRDVSLPYTVIPLTNVASAFAALSLVGYELSSDDMSNVVATTALPGRRQRIAENPNTYLDVGHNPQATASLAHWLQQQSFTALRIVIGMLNDKALNSSLAAFAGFNPVWYLGTTTGPRGLSANALANAVPNGQHSKQYESVVEAYNAARCDASKEECILVVGSFHTVADVLALPHNILN